MIYSKGSRFRCDPATGIIEEFIDDGSHSHPDYVPLPPVPKNWKDPRKPAAIPKPKTYIRTWTEEMSFNAFD